MILIAAVTTALVICGGTLLVRTGVVRSTGPTGRLTAGPGVSSPLPSPTGRTEDPGTRRSINLHSPGLAGIVNGLGHGYPLPPGGSWSYYLKAAGEGRPQWVSHLDVLRALHRLSVCQWELYWLDRSAHHDEAGTGAAWSGVQKTSAWTFSSGVKGSPGSFWITDVYGARSQDPGLIGHDVQANCRPEMWPAGAGR